MKNNVVYYALIALGVVALAVGVYYLHFNPRPHQLREMAAFAAGVVLIIAGIVGMFVIKPRISARAVAK